MYAPIKKVKARYQKRLFRYPGVVSLGIGRGEKGEKNLVIGVLEELSIQTARKIPSILEGYSVKLEVVSAHMVSVWTPGKRNEEVRGI